MWLFIIIFFGIMPAIITTCIVLLISDIRRTAWLKKHGVDAKATIIRLLRIESFRPQLFFVTYEYCVNEQVYLRRQHIRWQTYKKLKAASEVDIKYTPDDAKKSQLMGNDEDHVNRLYWVISYNYLGRAFR